MYYPNACCTLIVASPNTKNSENSLKKVCVVLMNEQ